MTAFDIAQRYVGIQELPGGKNHPLISWWLSLCGFELDSPDEIAWCSAFVNGIAWDLRLPRSKSAAARSWLTVGESVLLADAVGEVQEGGENRMTDYAALAKQFGGTSTAAPADYAALAKQVGGTTTEDVSRVDQIPGMPQGPIGDRVPDPLQPVVELFAAIGAAIPACLVKSVRHEQNQRHQNHDD